MCRVNVIGSRGTRSFIYSVHSFAAVAAVVVVAVAATDAVTAADAVYVAPATGLSAYLSFLYTYEKKNTYANCRLFRDRDMIVIGFGPQSERLNGTNL